MQGNRDPGRGKGQRSARRRARYRCPRDPPVGVNWEKGERQKKGKKERRNGLKEEGFNPEG